MVGDTTPPSYALAEHGVARVSFGPHPYVRGDDGVGRSGARGERVITNSDPNNYKFAGKERDSESGHLLQELGLELGLLKLSVFGFGRDEDGDVGVGVFPECEEFFVISNRPYSGSVGICPLRGC
jgi:hypothetical protein